MRSTRLIAAAVTLMAVTLITGCSSEQAQPAEPSWAESPAAKPSVKPSATATPSPSQSLSATAQKELQFADDVAAAIQGGADPAGTLPSVTAAKADVLVGGTSVGKIPSGMTLMILANEQNTGMCVIGTGGQMPGPDTIEVTATKTVSVDECSSEYGKMLVVETAS